MFMVVFQFFLFLWSVYDNIGEMSKIFCDQGKSESGNDYFIYEMILSDESFDVWIRFYVIIVEILIDGDF